MITKQEDGSIVVAPSGKLDTVNAPEFSQELSTVLETKPTKCIVDMSAVVFLSSSGLQALLLGAKISKKEGIAYAVCGMDELVKDVFTLSGFDRFITVFSTLKEALQKL